MTRAQYLTIPPEVAHRALNELYHRLAFIVDRGFDKGLTEIDLSAEKRDFARYSHLKDMFRDLDDPTRVPLKKAREIVQEATESLGITYGEIYAHPEIDGEVVVHFAQFNPKSDVRRAEYLKQPLIVIEGSLCFVKNLFSVSTRKFAIYDAKRSEEWALISLVDITRNGFGDRKLLQSLLKCVAGNPERYAKVAGSEREKYRSARGAMDEIYSRLVNSNAQEGFQRETYENIVRPDSIAESFSKDLREYISRNLGGVLLQIDDYVREWRVGDAKLALLSFLFNEDLYYRVGGIYQCATAKEHIGARIIFSGLREVLGKRDRLDPNDLVKSLESRYRDFGFVIEARDLLQKVHDDLFYSEPERRAAVEKLTPLVLSSVQEGSYAGPSRIPPVNPRLTVIVPAYNEAKRIGPTLESIVKYLDARGTPYEVIVVDDGSKDNTAELVDELAKRHPQVRCERVEKNSGKGNAVRRGMRLAKGELVLFTDADGATPIEELERLEKRLADGGLQIAIGSRSSDGTGATQVDSTWWRRAVGRVFNFAVSGLLLSGVKDTQCGFKLFTSEAAKFLSAEQRSERFGFDVELLYMARRAEMPIGEVPVNWQDQPGSKVNVWRDGIKMFLDLLKFRFQHRDINPESYREYCEVRREMGAYS